MTDPTKDHSRVSPQGRAMGVQTARIAEKSIATLVAQGVPDDRCKSCAFRAGTVPNGCVQTQSDALKAVVEDVPFMCHQADQAGEPCHGWLAARVAILEAEQRRGTPFPITECPWEFSPPDELLDLLAANGYTDVVRCGKTLIGLYRFNFTTGLVVGLTESGYERRYCYEHESDARAALDAWDGAGHPSGPWIKCKGQGIDLLNPELSA